MLFHEYHHYLAAETYMLAHEQDPSYARLTQAVTESPQNVGGFNFYFCLL